MELDVLDDKTVNKILGVMNGGGNINDLKKKSAKISAVYIRSTPVMEVLTGLMIAILIFYSGKLIISEELGINNFFSFLAAMMLAYQPVKTLTKVNVAIAQGMAAAERILPIIDTKIPDAAITKGRMTKLISNPAP